MIIYRRYTVLIWVTNERYQFEHATTVGVFSFKFFCNYVPTTNLFLREFEVKANKINNEIIPVIMNYCKFIDVPVEK